ncbi:ubiquitin-related modifier 1 isoform X3 [Paramormyrops kingsleyae]|uniref:ubiquitin-related modifier 1 isoform X3 n=1 Tax=Paramormyrops kingsleyae TaxID=1676925 RepID=UPI000CD661CC|nr:ubiquitin-related modifier 1 isoform X3 [Paramormyrops kingsleyae]
MAASIVVHLEFGGGAELLFAGVRNHQVTLPSQSQPYDVKRGSTGTVRDHEAVVSVDQSKSAEGATRALPAGRHCEARDLGLDQ